MSEKKLSASTIIACSAAGFFAVLNLLNYLANTYKLDVNGISAFGIGLLVCSVGSKLAYKFRQAKRFVYGAVEVGVGMVTGGAVVYTSIGPTAPSQFVSFLALLGAVYIGVRGFDNIEQGKPKSPGATSNAVANKQGAPLDENGHAEPELAAGTTREQIE